MGHGSYTASDWSKLKQSRGIGSGSDVSQLFTNRKMDDRYDPRFIHMRESCDSADSPESTPIILAFDDTGSMGYLAEEIAKNALNNTITQIYAKQPVTNPHVLCAAFGNHQDMAPLQVTQFEADIRVVEQLLDLWIEQGGSGYSGDTYVWYFAAKHTKTDSFDKRGRKGFLFTLGDDYCSRKLDGAVIQKIFNDDERDYTVEELIRMAGEKYEVFHIITKPLSPWTVERWKRTLPGRVAVVDANSMPYLAQVITSIMQLSGGKPRAEVLAQWDGAVKDAVSHAVQSIALSDTGTEKKKWHWPF